MVQFGKHHVGDYVDHEGNLRVMEPVVKRRVGATTVARLLYEWLCLDADTLAATMYDPRCGS